MFRGSKKDLGFATRCFGAEEDCSYCIDHKGENTPCAEASIEAKNLAQEESEAGLSFQIEIEKKIAVDQSRGLEKDISGSEKRAVGWISSANASPFGGNPPGPIPKDSKIDQTGEATFPTKLPVRMKSHGFHKA